MIKEDTKSNEKTKCPVIVFLNVQYGQSSVLFSVSVFICCQ